MAFSLKLDERVPASLVGATQREPMKFEAGQVVQVHPPDLMFPVGVLVDCVDEAFSHVGGSLLDRPRVPASFSMRIDPVRVQVVSPAPRAGDAWSSGESVARIDADGDRLRIVTQGEPFVGDVVAVARKLWEGGYRLVEARSDSAPSRALRTALDDVAVQMTRVLLGTDETDKLRVQQMAHAQAQKWIERDVIRKDGLGKIDVRQTCIDATTPQSEHAGAPPTGDALTVIARERLGIEHLPNESDDALRARMERVLRPGMRPVWRHVFPYFEWQPALDDRVRGDHAIDVGAHNVPTLRAGMVVRREPCESLKPVVFGRVLGRHGTDVRIHWLGDSGPWHYASAEVDEFIRAGSWTIVDPDVRPLASLANAVAAIFATPDLATSRRYVDIACAQLRGEPFAAAIRAALVGWCERCAPAPVEIAAYIANVRAYERARGEVAPGVRTLTREQRHAVVAKASAGCFPGLVDMYERARAAC